MNENEIVFQSLHPVDVAQLPEHEVEKYLYCKFFHLTKKEAKLFLYYYIAPVHYETLHRAIGIISGDLLLFDNPDDFYAQKEFDKKYKHIIEAIQSSHDYPAPYLIDDIIDWADKKQLVAQDVVIKTRAIIEKVRGEIFNSPDVSDDVKKNVLKLILQRDMNFILDEDAKKLLNLDEVICSEMKAAVENGQITNSYYSKDKKVYYFDPRALMKWLMQYDYFRSEWVSDFLELKKESIKATVFPTPKVFTLEQLQTWLAKNYPDEQDVFYHVNNKVYNAYINKKDGASSLYSERKLSLRGETTYKKRYVYLERLLLPDIDHHEVLKKLLDGEVIKATEYRNYVNLDSTDDEHEYGLHRVFYLRKKNQHQAYNQLSQEDLRFIVDEVKTGLAELLSVPHKKIKKNAKRNGKLSGVARGNESAKKWNQLKKPLLKLAKEHQPVSGNGLASIATRRDIISLEEVSNFGKKIRTDPEFQPYLKIRK